MSELSINEVVKIVQELKALERKFGEEKGLINLFKKLIQDSSKLDESLKLHSLKIEEIVKYVNSSKNDIQKERGRSSVPGLSLPFGLFTFLLFLYCENSSSYTGDSFCANCDGKR